MSFKIQKNVESFIHLFVNDLDFSSIYPTLTRVLNISRGTVKRALFFIENTDFHDIQRYFSNLINIKENTVLLCNEYFNLPNYTDMEKIFKKTYEENDLNE